MKQAPDIRFIGLEPSAAMASAAREKAAKLELFCPEIMACRIVIELAHKHRQQGRRFAVRLNLTLPGRELTVNRVENEDPYVALRDAFDGMKRQVEDTVERMREPLKAAAATAQRQDGAAAIADRTTSP